YKGYVDKALPRVPDADLHTELDANSNSIAVIIKHVSGNLRSRFRDFLTADGEKPDRNRDTEFEMPDRPSRDELLVHNVSSNPRSRLRDFPPAEGDQPQSKRHTELEMPDRPSRHELLQWL